MTAITRVGILGGGLMGSGIAQAGMFGKKSGRGFYDYSGNPPRVSSLGL